MLSESRLEEYRQLIMTTVGHHINTLRDHIGQDAAASGNSPESTLPNANRYVQLQAEILDLVNAELLILEAEGNLTKEADQAGATEPSGRDPARSAAIPSQGIAEGAMADDPFFDPEINRQIVAKILRLQAASLEWDANPAGRGFADHIVDPLVEALDAHAGAYLRKVASEELISQYGKYIRRVGSACPFGKAA
jgi:hypothetical protein